MGWTDQVTFGSSGLDRAAELRGDKEKMAALYAEPSTRIIPFWRGKPALMDDDRTLATVAPGSAILKDANEAPIFLGRDEDGAWFAINIDAWQPKEIPDALGAFLDPTEQRHPALPESARFVELRRVMAMVSMRDAELLAIGKGILSWHSTHQFCARCGAPSEIAQAGWQRNCPSCGAHHFPRTDPVVIMLILKGNSVLVGRSPQWPERMYSLLAGFVEPGETLEAAVRREVFEETGVMVGQVDYLVSQPWPFPSSLMFGCRGIALTDAITVDPVEIEDAIWVPREEMAEILLGTHPTVNPPRKGAVARFMVEAWLQDQAGVGL
ncbi:MAG: NAD(+) diphosphatase [Pseudomonadota bacterium]